jgi:hypothetical protein
MAKFTLLKAKSYGGQKAYRFQIGMGAGCKGGATIYLAINCHSRKFEQRLCGRKLIQAGITRNANLVPYCNF